MRLSRYWRFLALASVMATAALCYANTLSGQFVMDDVAAILQNADVRCDTHWSALWTHDYWGDAIASPRSHKSYRPLTVATFRLNFQATGDDPFFFHATNVVLHSVASAAVTVVCWTVIEFTTGAGTVCGLLFAVHPVHTEAVANVVGRAELLCCIMFCASIVLSKQAVLGRTALTRTSIGPSFSMVDNPHAYETPFATRLYSLAFLHVRYAFLLVFPSRLSCDYSFNAIKPIVNLVDVRNLATALLYTCGAVATTWAWMRKERTVLWAIGLIVLPFVPASNLLVYVGTTVGERLLYLPSMGACIIATMGLYRAPRALRHPFLVILLATAGSRTWSRNYDWSDALTLFTADVQVQPDSCKLHICLATAHLDVGNFSMAIKHAKDAVRIHPQYPGQIHLGRKREFIPDVVVSALNNLGTTYLHQGQSRKALTKAERHFRSGLQIEPGRHSLLTNLAEALKLQGKFEAAIPFYQASLSVKEDAQVHNNLAMALFEVRGMRALANVTAHYERALQLDPNNISALDNTSQVYAHLGMYDKAVSLLTRLVRLRPNNPKFSARLRHVLSAQPRQAA